MNEIKNERINRVKERSDEKLTSMSSQMDER